MDNKTKGPKFIQYFQPIIDALIELGGSGQPTEVKKLIAENLSISEEEQSEQISSGASRFSNSVDWARFYLARAGYIDSSTRGVWSLTEPERNLQLSNEDALELFQKIHKQFSVERKKKKVKTDETAGEEASEDLLDDSIDHRVTLLNKLMELPPNGFERLCQRLLRESGFESVSVTGRSGDGGIEMV